MNEMNSFDGTKNSSIPIINVLTNRRMNKMARSQQNSKSKTKINRDKVEDEIKHKMMIKTDLRYTILRIR